MFQYLKGAIFFDIGNIWLLDNDDLPEGNFTWDTFYRELAVGTGFGFRLDFNYFLLRLDLAFPLRKPIFNEGFRWVASDIDLLDSEWRSENLRWNLGIGYPF